MRFASRAEGFLVISTAVIAALRPSAAGGQTVLYVDDDAPPQVADGSSWATAFTDLQKALDLAVASRGAIEIRIGQGVYKPTLLSNESDKRSATFQLPNGIVMIGGFAGTPFKDPDDRDIKLYPTVLSGDLDGDDGGPGTFANYAENAHHVVSAFDVDGSTVLDGVTITAGNACCGFQFESHVHGGGVYGLNASIAFKSCTFTFNRSGWRGAGCYLELGQPTFADCRFVNNVATNRGGGLHVLLADLSLTNCEFKLNQASSGGGIYQSDGSLHLTNCIFTENQATDFPGGGAVRALFTDITVIESCTFASNVSATGYGAVYVVQEGGQATIINTTFTDNSAELQTGALGIFDGPTIIENCLFQNNNSSFAGGALWLDGTGSAGHQLSKLTFVGNSTSMGGGGAWISNVDSTSLISECEFINNAVVLGQGGGIYLDNSQPSLDRCLFRGNVASRGGGAYAIGSEFVFTNCLFKSNLAANTTLEPGGGLYYDPSLNKGSSSLINCTFQGNVGSAEGGTIYSGGPPALKIHNCIIWNNSLPCIGGGAGGLEVWNSDVEGGWNGPGGGNFSANPDWANPATLDFRLLPGSPCIDAGDNDAVPKIIDFDFAGAPRFRDDPKTDDNGLFPVIDLGAFEFHPPCAADCAQPPNGIVDVDDLLTVIGAWGDNPESPADITGNGIVDVDDLLIIVDNWGSCD